MNGFIGFSRVWSSSLCLCLRLRLRLRPSLGQRRRDDSLEIEGAGWEGMEEDVGEVVGD